MAIAHRGGSLTGPNPGIENSLEAFAHAVSLGYRHLETDVVCSRDGVAIIAHDPHLLRLTGVDAFARDLTADQIDELRLDGRARLPRLDELLRAHPDAWISIDVKTDDAVEETCRVLEEHDAVDRVVLGSFDHKRITAIRKRLPAVETSASQVEVARSRLHQRASSRRPAFRWLSVPPTYRSIKVVTRRFVDAAHARGIGVLVWTVDDAHEMSRLIDLGVDGIYTDRTDVLRDVLVARGEWESA